MEELKKVPQELSKVYEHILSEVIELRNRPRTLLLMQWICLAESPLTVADIRFSMASDDAYIDERRQSCSDLKDFVGSDERMQRLITSISGGLVETIRHKHNGFVCVQHIDQPVNDGSIVQFIHQSIKDFLLSGGLKFLAQYQYTTARMTTRSHRRQSLAKATIGYTSCINYLKLEDVSIIYDSSFRYRIRGPSQPFVRYATQYWLVHAEEAEQCVR
ncbi:hypothetical protein VC83_08316 [Pseudogymnoascus destructans]|uniref:Uncharacterized protein n=1 Tax=Pseudogymnoascus destructans TaxID=655981 RepID=A0A177A2P5_9PEZI|nr:uncharacterized protein VC83_08316 [Pseudogymnoascus destructans]OAF55363.1 hypothetical protein VC83_08316 [Pseudogymnoascus destructans]